MTKIEWFVIAGIVVAVLVFPFEYLRKRNQVMHRQPTYTVETPVCVISNVVEVIRDHAPSCTLVRYRQGGKTNEFHAWMVPVTIITNQ